MANVSSSQEFDDSKVKLIQTNFDVSYSFRYHFSRSNSPVAPRTDGGYYIAFTEKINIYMFYLIIKVINY